MVCVLTAIGNVVQIPVKTHVPKVNSDVYNFTVVVHEYYAGAMHDLFIQVSKWSSPDGDGILNTITKGSSVWFSGPLHEDHFTNKITGAAQQVIKVVAHSVQFVPGTKYDPHQIETSPPFIQMRTQLEKQVKELKAKLAGVEEKNQEETKRRKVGS